MSKFKDFFQNDLFNINMENVSFGTLIAREMEKEIKALIQSSKYPIVLLPKLNLKGHRNSSKTQAETEMKAASTCEEDLMRDDEMKKESFIEDESFIQDESFLKEENLFLDSASMDITRMDTDNAEYVPLPTQDSCPKWKDFEEAVQQIVEEVKREKLDLKHHLSDLFAALNGKVDRMDSRMAQMQKQNQNLLSFVTKQKMQSEISAQGKENVKILNLDEESTSLLLQTIQNSDPAPNPSKDCALPENCLSDADVLPTIEAVESLITNVEEKPLQAESLVSEYSRPKITVKNFKNSNVKDSIKEGSPPTKPPEPPSLIDLPLEELRRSQVSLSFDPSRLGTGMEPSTEDSSDFEEPLCAKKNPVSWCSKSPRRFIANDTVNEAFSGTNFAPLNSTLPSFGTPKTSAAEDLQPEDPLPTTCHTSPNKGLPSSSSRKRSFDTEVVTALNEVRSLRKDYRRMKGQLEEKAQNSPKVTQIEKQLHETGDRAAPNQERISHIIDQQLKKSASLYNDSFEARSKKNVEYKKSPSDISLQNSSPGLTSGQFGEDRPAGDYFPQLCTTSATRQAPIPLNSNTSSQKTDLQTLPTPRNTTMSFSDAALELVETSENELHSPDRSMEGVCWSPEADDPSISSLSAMNVSATGAQSTTRKRKSLHTSGPSGNFLKRPSKPFLKDDQMKTTDGDSQNPIPNLQASNPQLSGRIRKKVRRPCPFCPGFKFLADLSQHLKTIHSDQEIVKEIFRTINRQKRNHMLGNLKKAGIAKYNEHAIKHKKPLLNEKSRQQNKKKLVQCAGCRGFYVTNSFYIHRKRCLQLKNVYKARGGNCSSPSMLNLKNLEIYKDLDSNFVNKVCSTIHNDSIGTLLLSNELILYLGSSFYTIDIQKGKVRRTINMTRKYMRCVSTLFQTFKDECSRRKKRADSLLEMFRIENYPLLEECLQSLVHDGDKFKHGTANDLRVWIKRAIQSLMNKFSTKSSCEFEKLESFLHHFRQDVHKYTGKVSYRNIVNNNSKSYITRETLETLLDHIREEINEISHSLHFNRHKLCRLKRALLGFLLFFNANTPEEISSLRICHWKEAKKNVFLSREEEKELSETERKILEHFRVMYNSSKVAEKVVSIIVPLDVFEAMEILTDPDVRFENYVPPNNDFIFASTSLAESYINWNDEFKELCQEAGIETNVEIHSYKLRHRINNAIHRMTNSKEKLNKFFEHFGRFEEINKSRYTRLPDTVIKVPPLDNVHPKNDSEAESTEQMKGQRECKPVPSHSSAVHTRSKRSPSKRIKWHKYNPLIKLNFGDFINGKSKSFPNERLTSIFSENPDFLSPSLDLKEKKRRLRFHIHNLKREESYL